MLNPFRIFRLLAHVRRPSRIAVMDVFIDGFWLKKGYEAMTFFGTIVIANEVNGQRSMVNDDLRRHETIHLRQAQSTHDSWLLFYLLYFWYILRALPQNRRMKNAAYRINPFELEAYRHMDDPAYLEQCKEKGATEWRTFARMSPRERLKKFYHK
jgi:hypothetical protein